MENIVNDIKKIIDENITLVEINGEKYTNQSLRPVRNEERVEKICFNDLASIVKMIKNEGGIFKAPLYINIVSAEKVSVFTTTNEYKDREYPYCAESDAAKFRFGSYHNFEDFVIAMRSQFVQNEDSKEMLAMLKKITNNNSVETEDDGITQKITAQQGTSLSSAVKATPIRKLTPYRTFIEVEQPTSEFLFRVGDGSRFALFEADGGAWKRKAKENISKYFEEQLKDEIKSGKVVLVG